MERITTRQQQFIDAQGRTRIFHGINIIDKSYTQEVKRAFCQPINKKDMEGLPDSVLDNCAKAGFNLIRLGFNWANIEPQPGQYNESYIDSLEDILDRCALRGIYVFLDLHQDLYANFPTRFGDCDGAPLWAAHTEPYTVKKQRLVWADGYFWDKGIQRAFDNFWTNAPHNGKGLQDYFADMLRHLARRLGDHSALFGWDYLNEPYIGKEGGRVFRKLIANLVKHTLFDRDIKLGKLLGDALIPKRRDHLLDNYGDPVFHRIALSCTELIRRFDEERYGPFLNKMTAAVREITPNGIAFADNCYYSNLGIPCAVPPIAVNGVREKQQCFQPHGYDLTVDTPAYAFANNSRIEGIFAEHRRTQQRLNTPVVVGEWGGGGEGDRWLPHVRFLMDLFDSYQWSNAYFCYGQDFFEQPLMQIIARPYPMAVAGTIQAYAYQSESKRFTLEFTQEGSGSTQIYLPRACQSIEAPGETRVLPIDGSEAVIVEIDAPIGAQRIVIQL